MALSFIVDGNLSTRRIPICCTSLTKLITYCCIEYTSTWTGFDLITLVVIYTDCIGSCKSNYEDHDGPHVNRQPGFSDFIIPIVQFSSSLWSMQSASPSQSHCCRKHVPPSHLNIDSGQSPAVSHI